MESSAESKSITSEAIARYKPLNHPYASLYIFEEGELVHLGDHLPEIELRAANLAHLPIGDEYFERGFAVLDGSVWDQDTRCRRLNE